MTLVHKFILTSWEHRIGIHGMQNKSFKDLVHFVNYFLHSLSDESRIKGLDYLKLLEELDT